MRSLHEYEDWLDKIDKLVSVKGAEIVCELGSGLSVPVVALIDVNAVAPWVGKLAECLDRDKVNVPEEYVLKRFARLAQEQTKLSFDVDEVVWETTVGYRRK